ncbi:MAG: hypothetical protein AAF236_16215 [Verrucomicrobiota bacterium]
MPRFLLLSLALLSFATFQASAEEVRYTGALTGVECQACKRTVATAIGKIKGVKIVRIVALGDGKHRLEVHTDGSTAITLTQARAALKRAEHYQIKSWRVSS